MTPKYSTLLPKQLLNLQKKRDEHKEAAIQIEGTIIGELNPIIFQLYKKNLSSYHNISISLKTVSLDSYHFLAGTEVLEVWETDDENEYARQYSIPIWAFSETDIAKKFADAEENWKVELRAKTAKRQEEIDRREFIRLSKKFKKK